MNKQFLRYLQVSLLTLDIMMLNLIIMISKSLFNERIGAAYESFYFHFLIFLNISWLVITWTGVLYSEKNLNTFEAFSRRTMHLFVFWVCCILIYLFFYRQFELSRFFIAASISVFALGLLLNRFAYIGLRKFYMSKEQFSKRILILGYNKVAKELVGRLEEDDLNTEILGFLEEPSKVTELSHYPIINTINHTLAVAKSLQINEIYSTITPEQNYVIYDLMQQAESECIRFKIIPDLSFFVRRQIHIDYMHGMPVITLRKDPLEDIGNRAKKRLLDILISFFVVVFVLSWLVPLLGLLIYLESPGPIFFGQNRTGKNKKSFRCFKFRSMKISNDADSKQATKGDSRITKIGSILRKTSLDEFPQFWNVLKGEMSLVGPRPHMLKHTEDYSKIVNQYMVRQFLKPGITGWAQINGYRGEIHDPEEIIGRVNCDIWYSENWSLWLDIRIIFLTFYKVMAGDKKAY